MAKQDFPALLAIGFHPMTIGQMRATLVSSFQSSKTRPMIMDGFERLVNRLNEDKIEGQFWIDGSFLTKKTEPEDADVLLLIDGDFYEKASTAQKVLIDWFGWRKADVKKDYYCHAFVHFVHKPHHREYSDSVWYNAYWLRQFGFGHNDGAKGIATFQFP